MSQEFEGPGLAGLDDSYGLSGIDAEQTTILDDGNVSQILPIEAIVRRSREAPGVQRSMGYMLLRNEHAVASAGVSFSAPYAPTFPTNGYSIDPKSFDIWLLGASMVADAGDSGLFTFGSLALLAQNRDVMMVDLNTGGGMSPVAPELPIAAWDETTIIDTVGGVFCRTTGGVIDAVQPRRIQLLTSFSFRTVTTAAANATCILTLGFFPIRLGQDGVP